MKQIYLAVRRKMFLMAILAVSGWALMAEAANYEALTPLLPTASAVSASLISVRSEFFGDANDNSYTTYEYGLSRSGPWNPTCNQGIPGASRWRYCDITGLVANTVYFIRVTHHDPDGVTDSNPSIIAARTLASSTNSVALAILTPFIEDTHITVRANLLGDANNNSSTVMEVATNPNGPWRTACGLADSSSNLRLCRIHGLQTERSYYVRVTLQDPDGVSGSNPWTFGPYRYTGLTNLALNATITADPGWGCCPNPAELVDGRIQYDDWTHGFAWCGGTDQWCGTPPGWKQATVDLGGLRTVRRVDWWPHDQGSIPLAWKVEVSRDGTTFTEVHSATTPVCRTATEYLWTG